MILKAYDFDTNKKVRYIKETLGNYGPQHMFFDESDNVAYVQPYYVKCELLQDGYYELSTEIGKNGQKHFVIDKLPISELEQQLMDEPFEPCCPLILEKYLNDMLKIANRIQELQDELKQLIDEYAKK